MICSICKKTVIIPDAVFAVADAYRTAQLSISECCGAGFVIKPHTEFDVIEYIGDETEDDWGNKITKNNSLRTDQ